MIFPSLATGDGTYERPKFMGALHVSAEQSKATNPPSHTQASRSPTRPVPAKHPLNHPLLKLQQTIGNQGVQRLLHSQPVQGLRPSQGGLLQRKCACGGTPGLDGECTECRQKRLRRQRYPTSQPEAGAVPPIVHEVLRLSGQPLDPNTRAFMEPRFGHNFSRVRVHADVRAVEAEMKIRGQPAPQKAALLSDTGDADREEKEDDSVVKQAQVGGHKPPSTCAYSITYANLKKPGCGGTHCGAKVEYDITRVRARGSGCPPTLRGLRLTETVTTDGGCAPGAVTTGPGAVIGPRGRITGITDTYGLCAPPATFPARGCTERYTQRLFVGGVLAETRTITFRITKAYGVPGKCSGTVTRR
jgi:hypothetical protein